MSDRPIVTFTADPTATYSGRHDTYDDIALWLIWLPLTVPFLVILALSFLLVSPLVVPMWLVERWREQHCPVKLTGHDKVDAAQPPRLGSPRDGSTRKDPTK